MSARKWKRGDVILNNYAYHPSVKRNIIWKEKRDTYETIQIYEGKIRLAELYKRSEKDDNYVYMGHINIEKFLEDKLNDLCPILDTINAREQVKIDELNIDKINNEETTQQTI